MNFKEVKIGNQIWTGENLSIDNGGEGIYHHDGETYYTWEAAVRVAESVKGWHLPTKEEFETLIETAGGEEIAGTKLKSTTGWNENGNGTDDFGFSVFPVGYRGDDGRFLNSGYVASFWSATENYSYSAYGMYLGYYSGNAYLYLNYKRCALPIRLVKD